jgi:hypothetical protein
LKTSAPDGDGSKTRPLTSLHTDPADTRAPDDRPPGPCAARCAARIPSRRATGVEIAPGTMPPPLARSLDIASAYRTSSRKRGLNRLSAPGLDLFRRSLPGQPRFRCDSLPLSARHARGHTRGSYIRRDFGCLIHME